MSKQSSSQQEKRIDNAIAFYEQRLEQIAEGSPSDQQESIARQNTIERFPDVAQQLADHIRHSNMVERACASMRQAFSTPAPPPIKGYRDLTEIGRGGMSIVYRARQADSQRFVAIKVIRDDHLKRLGQTSKWFAAAARSEAEATLDHPHIVRLYHSGESHSKYYLVLELIKGNNLGTLIRRRSLSLFQLVQFMHQTACALSFAHRRGILHRDVKPSNILIDEQSGIARLADFGLAVLHKESDSGPAKQHFLGGTKGYLAPELSANEGSSPTIAADVYSFGATLFEGLTGRLPPEDSTNSNQFPVEPRAFNPAIPVRLNQICKRCLAPNPEHRFQSMAEVSTALESLLIELNAAQLFVRMGWLLIGFGILVAILNCLTNVLIFLDLHQAWTWLTFFSPHLALFLVFALTKVSSQAAAYRATRELWTIWIGHFLATLVIIFVLRQQDHELRELIQRLYPFYGIITALSAWIMGANFWKGHYFISVFWILVTAVMTFSPSYAPTIFGLATLVASLAIGTYELYLRNDRSLERPLRYPDDSTQLSHLSLLIENHGR